MSSKPKRAQAGQCENINKQQALTSMIFQERKFWAIYRSMSELLLSPKEGWRRLKWTMHVEVQRPEKRASSWEEGLRALFQRVSVLLLSAKEGWPRMKWKLYAEVQCPEKQASSWEEGLSSLSLLEGGWAVAESQRGMTQDEVKNVCRGATPWKTGIFLRGRFELFTGGWVSWCWVPKRDDTENEKSSYKRDEGNRKEKYKHFVWSNLMYKKVFHSLVKTYKGSCKHLILGHVQCSDEFFIKHLISKKKEKRERKKGLIPFIS